MIVFLTDIKDCGIKFFCDSHFGAGYSWSRILCYSQYGCMGIQPCTGIDAITDNWLVSSLLYVSYNSISGVAVMCSLLPYLKSRKIAAAGGIIGGLALSFIAIVLNIILYVFYPDIVSEEIPVLSISAGIILFWENSIKYCFFLQYSFRL